MAGRSWAIAARLPLIRPYGPPSPLGEGFGGGEKLKFVFPPKLCYNKVLTKEKEGFRYGLYPETDL